MTTQDTKLPGKMINCNLDVESRREIEKSPAISLTSKINFLLFTTHAHLSFVNYYRRFAWAPPEAVGERILSGNRKSGSGAERAEVHQWDWQGVGDLWAPIRYYVRVSNFWMLFVFIKTLFSEQLFKLAHLLTGYPGHCIIVGRFVVHPTISGLVAFAFSSFHIAWRYVQYYERSNMMSLFVFLLQSEHDLEQFYGIMGANHRGDYLNDLNTSTGTGTGTGTGDHCFQVRTSGVSAGERFFRHIMCYEVHLPSGRVVYRLRANRNRDSHAHLAAHMTRVMTVTTCIFLLLFALIYPPVEILLFSDLRYVQTYPGCSPQLDHLYTSGRLKSIWSMTFTWHRLIAWALDLLENMVIWFDSGFAMTFVMATTHLMNYDILLYWHHLNAHIERNLARVRAYHELTLPVLRNRNKLPGHSGRPSARMRLAERNSIQMELNELICEIYDFFRQVERADKLISDLLSMYVSVWLASVAGPTYYYLVRVSNAEFPQEVRALQLISFITLCIFTYHMLELHSNCGRTYELICSLMAYDQSTGSTHRKLTQVIEFFTDRKSTTYKLFQRIPYLATTYLTIIGWSFSSMVICSALFGREHHHHRSLSMAPEVNTSRPNVPIMGGSKYSAFSSSL